jgi:sugar lactone lactonase YvrE
MKVNSRLVGFASLIAISAAIIGVRSMSTSTAQNPSGGPEPPWPVATSENVVRTFSGSGPSLVTDGSFRDGSATEARFDDPSSLAFDSSGRLLVADFGNNRIRRISSDGSVQTVAGTGAAGDRDGSVATATFNGPAGIAVDNVGNILVSDAINHKIRRISPDGQVVTIAGAKQTIEGKEGQPTTIALGGFRDGPSQTALFNRPAGLAVDTAGNIYVADKDNHRIRKINPAGTVSSFAGSGAEGSRDGIGEQATFSFPVGLTMDVSGNLYVTEQGHFGIRRVSPAGEVTTIFAQEGPSGLAGIAVDTTGTIYFADGWASQVRLILPDRTRVGLAGNERGFVDGPVAQAEFGYVTGIAVDSDGRVFVADATNKRIRVIEVNQ